MPSEQFKWVVRAFMRKLLSRNNLINWTCNMIWIVVVESEYTIVNLHFPQYPHGVAVGTIIHLERTVNIRRHVYSTEHYPL